MQLMFNKCLTVPRHDCVYCTSIQTLRTIASHYSTLSIIYRVVAIIIAEDMQYLDKSSNVGNTGDKLSIIWARLTNSVRFNSVCFHWIKIKIEIDFGENPLPPCFYFHFVEDYSYFVRNSEIFKIFVSQEMFNLRTCGAK